MIALDADPLAPALRVADKPFIVPPWRSNWSYYLWNVVMFRSWLERWIEN